MKLTTSLPPEFKFEADWSTKPVIRATRTSAGWIIAGAQHGVRSVLSSLDEELRVRHTRVIATGKDADWGGVLPLRLDAERCLLHVRGRH